MCTDELDINLNKIVMRTDELNADDNKLIALFMNIPNYEFGKYTMFVYADNNHRTHIDLGYHESIAWLKPVIAKCKKVCKENTLPNDLRKLNAAVKTGDVALIYPEVLSIAKWYMDIPQIFVTSSYDDDLHDPKKTEAEYWVVWVDWGKTEGTEDLAEAPTQEQAIELRDAFVNQLKDNPHLRAFDHYIK